MRGHLAVPVIALALGAALFHPVKAQAAPGQPGPLIEIHSNPAIVTPGSLSVEVEAACAPWSGGQGLIDVIVEQPIPATTNASEGEGMMTIPCDGVKRKAIVNVTGGPFQKGGANAYAQITAGALLAMTATDARKVTLGP